MDGEDQIEPPADWLSYRRSRNTRSAFSAVFSKALELSLLDMINRLNTINEDLQNYRVGDMHVLVDESQTLLEILPKSFHGRKREYDGDKPKHPRSFYSFFVRIVVQVLGYISLWAGTHLRLRDVSLFCSAAGGKMHEEILVFTDFDFPQTGGSFNIGGYLLEHGRK